MKKTITAVVAFLAAFAAQAVETSIAYQGVLRDDQGAVLQQPQQVIAFRLYGQASGGTALWGRSLAVLLDEQGLFNVELSDANGSALGDATNASLADALKSARGGSLYVGLTVEGSSGEIAPRQKILSVPYAGYAADVSKADGDFTVAGKATLADVSTAVLDVAGKATFTQQATFNNGVTVNGNLSVGNTGTLSGYGTTPIGGIIMWSGSPSQVPDGWALCDGRTSNGRMTPDLKGRFIVGYDQGDSDYGSVGKTGGAKSVALTVAQLPSHAHTATMRVSGLAATSNGDNDFFAPSWKTQNTTEQITTDSTGSGSAHENRPPYYALCFIMRVK